jgi:nuclear GTP-binding protein
MLLSVIPQPFSCFKLFTNIISWVAKRWIGELAAVRPTIAFHASMTHAFGKGALISLLRQFGKLHADKRQISVGVIGYPNVGKSSVINTLISKKSCKVAPIPGETKIWQYITLFKRIYLIDCPGVVVDSAGDTETDSVLKGVVRAERLETPEDFIPAIEKAVKREHIAAQYGLPKDGPETWKTSLELMEMIARKCGRLLKGGDPCLRSASIYLINDFQRGRLPHYVAPPELKEAMPTKSATASSAAEVKGIKPIEQDLDAIGKDPLKEDDVDMVDENAEGSKSDASESDNEGSEDEGEETKVATVALGKGDWDDAN